jgi:hypothetical protein
VARADEAESLNPALCGVADLTDGIRNLAGATVSTDDRKNRSAGVLMIATMTSSVSRRRSGFKYMSHQ